MMDYFRFIVQISLRILFSLIHSYVIYIEMTKDKVSDTSASLGAHNVDVVVLDSDGEIEGVEIVTIVLKKTSRKKTTTKKTSKICPFTYRMGVCLLKYCGIDKEQVVLSDYGWCHYCHEAMHHRDDSGDPNFNEEEYS